MMSSKDIRKKFLNFFSTKGGPASGGEHKSVPSSSLLPDDPSVLLTTAGMQQFKRFYTEPLLAPAKNVASIQKCFRTSDIDEVGDESHLTFFEMLGNFSFGGYFKKEAIGYAHDFLTKELGLEIDYVSVFAGESDIPADEESEKIWRTIDPKIEIKKFGKKDNFWGPTGSEGPCGPTSEIYVNGIEIWNLVFNEHYCKTDGSMEKLKTLGVDTGMGLERLAMVVQEKKNIFETDLFESIISKLGSLRGREQRIVADHMRGVVFLIGDGVMPNNKDQGYILRRLIRRVNSYLFERQALQRIPDGNSIPILATVNNIASAIIETFDSFEQYNYLKDKKETILSVLRDEYQLFRKTYESGSKILKNRIFEIKEQKKDILPGKDIFDLIATHGFSLEWIKDVAEENALGLDIVGYEEKFKKHQEISRAGAEKKFGGHGLLLNTGELKAKDEEELKKVTRLHTATHLLQAALRKIFGPEAKQMGSDITAERTRFDFSFSRKLTDEELKKVEDLVNEVISKKLSVNFKEMPIEEAKKTGALFFFKEKYPDKVKVYYVGKSLEDAFSKEFCGGPHVKNTSEIGHFKIKKSESIGASTCRIRATLE